MFGQNPNKINFEPFRTWQVEPRTNSKTELQNRTPNPLQKGPNFEHVRPEMGQTQAQIKKNWTSNSSEPRFVFQNWTTNPPEPSKNPELQTHEPGSTQHLIDNIFLESYSFVKRFSNGSSHLPISKLVL